ncbi:hypothetical protein IU510_26225 [Nocardia cyriacigeorgica]|uniref:hypothetical protein n=1 Tax=Nocardia cyriacigeorgica TaxID=135487 RepID=UPI0018944285|nr:hypothetical protein [Nocardia cyriacigeorgica]MBF6101523.1 hypothetical protein [Nocardia cyriacigeorgica]
MRTRLLRSAVGRLVGAVLVGLVIGAVVGALTEWPLGVLAGIATADTLFVVIGWFALWPMDADQTRANARREDFRPVIEELSVVGAASSGLIGIVVISSRICAITLRHNLLSYAFGTVILATTINLVVGIAAG